MVTVDVLSPRRKPSNGIVMNDLFPLSRDIGNWSRCIRSYVNCDILRIDAQLRQVSKQVRNEWAGWGPTLSAPFLGCSPRPLNRPGGSTLKLPTFSLRPSSVQATYFASISSFCFFSSFFSAALRAFFLAFSSSKYSNIGRKSQRSNSLIIVPPR